jgi:hypothetical protein
LEQGPVEKAIIEQCRREKRELPERIKNAPELQLGLELYYGAFLELSSCRSVGFGAEGPIPWTAVNQWARAHQLSEEQEEDLLYHIERMDEVYLKFKDKKAKPPPAPKLKGKSRGKR